MPSTNPCNNFSANPGDVVVWTDIPPSGCTLSQDGNKAWPFNPRPPITLPSQVTITVKNNLPQGTYCFRVSCCKKAIVCVTIT